MGKKSKDIDLYIGEYLDYFINRGLVVSGEMNNYEENIT